MQRISDLEKKYVLEALDNEFSTSKNSIFCNHLEKRFCEKLHTRYAIGHVNGTATLHTAIIALWLEPGDEIIVPPLTMSSTSLAVLQSWCIPVFADVNIDTFTIDPTSIKERITSKTKAIITVSLYWLSPDYDNILEICKKHNLYLIEDNAQCFLWKYKGKLVWEFGDFASYSFQASKHMTCGEWGMLTTNDEEFANKARRFGSLGYAWVSAKQWKITRNDIQDPNYSRHVSLWFNYRLGEVACAVALGQVERLDELIENRKNVAKIFDQTILSQSLLKKQAEPEWYENSYWSYSLVLNTDNPDKDWYIFRDIFLKNGWDGYYAARKLSYMEPYFINEVQKLPWVWQKYEKWLCPNAEFLQKRLIQIKTNYRDLDEAKKQWEILNKTINEYINL